MVERNCVKTVKNDMGDTIDTDELTELFEEASAQMALMKSQNSKPISRAMTEWLGKRKDTSERDAMIQKMNAAHNTLAIANGVQQIEASFRTGKDMAKGVPGILQGDGARTEFSADSVKDVYLNRWMSELDVDLTKIGDDTLRMLSRGDNDLEILQAMEALNKGEPTDGMNSYMVEVAKVLNRTTENMRSDLNESGAFIGKLDDHHWSQVHDQYKIKGSAEEWRVRMDEGLDVKRTFGFSKEDMAGDPALKELYDEVMGQWFQDLSTGNHLRVTPSTPQKGTGTGSVNIAKSVSQERKIHFKDAEAFHGYQKQFGVPTMFEALMMNVRRSSRNIGILQKLGPNYEANARSINNELIKRAKLRNDNEAVTALTQNGNAITRALRVVDGSIDVPDNSFYAKVFQGVRSFIGWTSLGGAALSALSDNASIAANARVNGRGMFSSTHDAMKGLFVNVKDKARVAKALGVTQNYMRAGVVDAGTAIDTSPGMISRINELYYRFNLLTPMTNRNRATVAIAESADLANFAEANAKFSDLELPYQRKLGLHDIDQPEWDVLRQSIEVVEYGPERTPLMTPEGVAEASDEAISSMLTAKGQTITDRSIKIARRDLENKVRSFYQDTVDKTVIEPKGRTRAAILLHTQEGTTVGIATRMMMQFKSFPLAVLMQRVQADAFLATGERATSKEAIKAYRSWGPAMGAMALNYTLWGYAAMSLKDIAKGIEPRDPMEDPFNVAAASFVQGGGAGILGDMLFAETNRFGGGLATTMIGPFAGKLAQGHDIYGQIKGNIMQDQDNEWFGNGIKLIYNNTPFLNLFYTKPAIDYFFADRVMNELRPGTMERRAQKKLTERGQESMWVQKEGF